MSEKMEVKLSQIRHYRSRSAADTAYRCGGFKGSVRSYTDHGQFLIPFRYFLGSRQAVHLVVDPVLFPYFLIVVEGIERAILLAVFALFRLGFSQKYRQGVAEIHGTDFLPLGGADLRLVSFAVVPHTAPHGQALVIQVDVLPCQCAGFTNPKSGVVGDLDGQQRRILFLLQIVRQLDVLLIGDHNRNSYTIWAD